MRGHCHIAARCKLYTRIPPITHPRSKDIRHATTETQDQGKPQANIISKLLMTNNQAEDLARVRRNQRKSRERKKERVLQLERRVEQLEAAATEFSQQSLEHENRALRGLLESVGFDEVSLTGYLQSTASTTQDQPGPASTSTSASDVQPFMLASGLSDMQFMDLEVGMSTLSLLELLH